MILRRRHRRRQAAQAELFQARQKALLLLTAKHPEYEFRGLRCPAPGHDCENEAGETGMIELGDAAPFQPLRCLRIMLFHQLLSGSIFLLAASLYQSSL